MNDVKKILDSEVREAPARVGSIAPSDVIIKAGPTGLDPKETGFFQKLSIATKIMRAKIEIINDFKIIAEGDKITPGQSALLDKLKMRPFEYKMTIWSCLIQGKIFPPGVLDIKEEDILANISKGVSNLTALSLGSGYVTPLAAPHLVMHSFKMLAAVSFATDYSFPQAENLKNAAAAAPVAVAAKAEEAPKAQAAAAAEPEEEEEDDDVLGDGMGLFGDDY